MRLFQYCGAVYREASAIPTWEDVLANHESAIKEALWNGEDEDYVTDEMYDRYEIAVYNVERGFQGDRCWRVVHLPKDVDPTTIDHIGVYWSFEEGAAEGHWNYSANKVKWTFEAVIDDLQIVDKAGSVYAYTDPLSGESEKEVTLKPNVPVRILDIEGGAGGYYWEDDLPEDDGDWTDKDWDDPSVGRWMTT